MDKLILDGMVRATASQTNPLLTNLEFIFTDFLPNKNRQGVPADEADNIIRTGVHVPVKADFRGKKLGDHPFSFPVGHITAMEQREDQIIGHAVLYKDEFPDLASHLEKASASEKGVHFSWELYHGNDTTDETGVQWLRDCVVAATTIVANPAYGGRTPLLAMASQELQNRIDELERQIASLTHNGGNSMDPVEELKQKLDDALARLAAVEATHTNEQADPPASDAPDIAALEAELTELREFKQTTEAQAARASVITTRRAALKDILSDDEFTAKSDFIADLTDPQFETFKESLASVAQKSKQSASYSGRRESLTPDPITHGDGGTTIAELGQALRKSIRG